MKNPRFLEYIESDGRQYIDTAIDLYGQATVELNAKITSPNTGNAALFGICKDNWCRYVITYGSGVSGTLRVEFTERDNWNKRFETWDTGLRKNAAIIGMLNAYVQGINVYVEGFPAVARISYKDESGKQGGSKTFKTGASFNFPASPYLFACHDYNAGAVDFASMRLESCSITGRVQATREGESGYSLIEAPVRMFYPALDEDGRACLYDAISDSYFYSMSGTDFIAGPEIDQMLFRVWNHYPEYTPSYILKAIDAVHLPQEAYYAVQPFNNPKDPYGDLYEFVGYDTSQAAFTAVYPTREYSNQGVTLDLSHRNQLLDVYAVWKYLYGYLVKDGNGIFYTKNDDGSRRNLGQLTLCAQSFRDYSFRGYPGADMLSDLSSPSIYNWTKKFWEDDDHVIHYSAPATFDVTLKGTPPLPQLMTFPTVTLEKPVSCVTIPADAATTRWNVSFDGGTTWYKYENAWIIVTEDGDGCEKRKLEILDAEDWAPVIVNNTLKFRAWLWKNAWVTSIRIDYMED